MKKTVIRKMIALTIMTTTVLSVSAIGANAEWKQNSDNTWSYDNITNGWFKDGNNWYFFKNGTMQTGWIKDTDGKWYYLTSNGNMLTNSTTPDGFKVDNNGVWIQNTTVNNTNNTANTSNTVSNTSNSNNMTNLTNNIDNSTSNNSSVTLNNTGVINANTTNNVSVDNTSSAEKEYYKQLQDSQKQSNNAMKLYYEKQLNSAKSDLAEAKKELANVESQKTVQTLKQDKTTGQWQYVGEVNTQKVAEKQQQVQEAQNNVDYYEKLVEQYS